MTSDTKNVSILKETDREIKATIPSKTEQEVIAAMFLKFRHASNERNMNFENFDGLHLIDYIDDSVRRYTTNVDFREDIEDWQARVHDPFTRNKVTAVLGKVVQVLPIAELIGRGDEDIRKGQILTNLYEYSEEVDDYEELMVNVLQEAIVKGTAIGYEGHEKKELAIRDIVGEGDDIRIREGKKRINRLYGDIVRLEDFYPSSVGIRRIKDMPYCFWRNVIPYQQFLQDFATFERALLVSPAASREGEETPAYMDYVSDDVGEGLVEIIRYYNRDVDEYIVSANGIWLNPIMLKGKAVISPLPFKHKELPFWDVRFENFDAHFFYGKSLPDKLKSMQDVLNVLTNMLLDQSFLTVFKPILTNGFDSIEDDYMRPGRRTPVDTQGLPIRDAFMQLDLGTPTGWHQYILEYTRKIMEEASVDQVSQGIAGGGDRTTAQEIRVAAEGVASMLGLFGRLVKYGIKRKAILRTKNILQFWTDKNNPIIERVLGEGGSEEFSKAFNVFRIGSATMTNGKRGQKIIELYGDRKEMPTRTQLKAREEIFKLETGKNIEIVALNADYIQNFEFDIKLIPNQKNENTRDAEQMKQLEKVRVYLSFFPEMVDKLELLAQTAEKLGDDPTKIIKENLLPGLADEGAMNSMVDKGMSTLPQGNMANNAARGMRGGEQMSNDLQSVMTG